MWLRSVIDRSGQHNRNLAARPMTPREIVNGIRKRRYAWGKPFQEIADECGLPVKTIRDVVNNVLFTDHVAATLVGYLRTPAGPGALVRNRDAGSHYDSGRRALQRAIGGLAVLARQYGIHTRGRERLKDFTEGDLRAYHWNLDQRTKEAIAAKNTQFARYLMPDWLTAWEWVERYDKLRARANGEGRTAPDRR